jgi:hypothetical protein
MTFPTRYQSNPSDCSRYRNKFCIPLGEDWSCGPPWAPGKGRTCLTSKTPSCTSGSTRSSGQTSTQSANRTVCLVRSPVVCTLGPLLYYDNLQLNSHCTHRSDSPYPLSPSSFVTEARRRHRTSFLPLCACTSYNNTYIACESVPLVSCGIGSVPGMSGRCSW